MTDPGILYEEMAGIAEFLPERPTIEAFIGALIAGFQTRFPVDFRRRVD
jgi:hypothetical protein